MSQINYLQGYAFAKKKGDTIHVFEGPHTLSDFLPVMAEGTDVPRMLKDRFADVVNVKDFGAIGDGTTDDTEAVQAALNAAVSGKKVFFPSGSYVVSTVDVPNGVSCIDFGFCKILKSSETQACIRFDGCSNLTLCNGIMQDLNGENRAGFLRGNGVSNLNIHNFNITNSTEDDQITGCWAITLSGENITIDGLYIDQREYGLWGDGIHFGQVKNLILTNFIILGGDDAIAFYQQPADGTGTYNDAPSENIVVGNGFLYSAKANCLKIGCDDSGTSTGHVVRNAHFHDIVCLPGSFNLINCVDERTASSLTNLYDDITFNNVIFSDSSTVNTAGAIRFNIPLRCLSFTNCFFSRETGASGYLFSASYSDLDISINGCAVRDVSGSSNNLFQITGKSVSVSNSRFESNSTATLFNASGSPTISIEGNIFSGSENGFSLIGLGALTVNSDIYISNNVFKNCQRSINKEAADVVAKRFIVTNNVYGTTNNFTDASATDHSIFSPTKPTLSANLFIQKDNPYMSLIDTTTEQEWRVSNTASNLYLRNSTETKNVLALSGADASVYPGADNAQNLGTSSYRWAQVHAATGTINTSDLRCKSSVASASDTLLDAVGCVPIHTFQFTDAVEKKGASAARFHVGVVAQEVASAFEAQGLDAARYGLFCHDEWQDEYETVEVVDQPEVLGEDGEVVTPAVTHTEQKLVIAAGDRYGIRYEEFLALECARLRRELQRIKTALTANGIAL